MNWGELVASVLPGLGRTVGMLIAIVVPLSIAIEVAKASGVLAKGGSAPRGAHVAMRLLGLSDQAALPLAAGFVFGMAYGAGLILQYAEEGHLARRDRMLIVLFLVACHAVIEDTLIFVPLGVNPLHLFVSRFTLAVVLTALAARFVPALRRGQAAEQRRLKPGGDAAQPQAGRADS